METCEQVSHDVEKRSALRAALGTAPLFSLAHGRCMYLGFWLVLIGRIPAF